MIPTAEQFIAIDLPPLLLAVLVCLTCGLLGNFLLLRRQSLMGDAISHSVLPGLVAAFLIAGSRASVPMFIGAAAAGLLAALLIEAVKRLGRVEPGAAMGVVFSVMFAGGVLLLEQASARGVDLDADCVLNGQLERVVWFPPDGPLLSAATARALPREVWTAAAVLLASALFVGAFFKELRLSAFDPALATALGIHAGVMHVLLMLLVAGAVVAGFEAVGSILVIAMLVCPAASARMFTDRLRTQIALSLLFALFTAIAGYVMAALVAPAVGFPSALSAAGMIGTLSAVLVALSIVVAPQRGLVASRLRRIRIARDVAREDLLAALYRRTEPREALFPLPAPSLLARIARREAILRGEVRPGDGPSGDTLTDAGIAAAREIVRTHRHWETFLVREAGLRADHVHDPAMQLEHLRVDAPAGAPGTRLVPEGPAPARDPHNRPLPPEHA